ncbi:septal ring lytic transglycosylase RlpA family protein [Trichlorobacter ammonificans]|uniref:Rare lipoprotein A n=1 Tax=Trichlorobacter ammonificans TaxID=2916410 RepID=A0ABN8HQN6_9BACT|nr:septal ring lytic transglycosylase RlpA family protein [Trichlorobacter ammonificans]CAH2032305.1 Rare lipoprotein A [Trichlorobacter ammonificans]
MLKPMLLFVLFLGPFLTASPAAAYLPDREALSDAELLETLAKGGGLKDPREGIATYYASRFIGRRTTSGERYHPDRFTAAHATLPLKTVVQVFNRTTGQGVQVVINDRCRKRSFQLIDLSRAAAQKIGLWGKGAMKVLIVPKTGNQLDELLAELEG